MEFLRNFMIPAILIDDNDAPTYTGIIYGMITATMDDKGFSPHAAADFLGAEDDPADVVYIERVFAFLAKNEIIAIEEGGVRLLLEQSEIDYIIREAERDDDE